VIGRARMTRAAGACSLPPTPRPGKEKGGIPQRSGPSVYFSASTHRSHRRMPRADYGERPAGLPSCAICHHGEPAKSAIFPLPRFSFRQGGTSGQDHRRITYQLGCAVRRKVLDKFFLTYNVACLEPVDERGLGARRQHGGRPVRTVPGLSATPPVVTPTCPFAFERGGTSRQP